MSRLITRPLKELTFVGGRFELAKGWLDFDVLPELQAYRQLLVETAKEEWRRRHPDRRNLPPKFSESIRLGFREVREGSCSVPIERAEEAEDDVLFEHVDDEIDSAVRIVDMTLIAARHNDPLPESLPTCVIPMFDEWGKTLASDEGIELDKESPETERPRLDATIRQRIVSARREPYEDIVDLLGEVRSATLKARDGGGFTIQLDDGDLAEGAFTAEQEAKFTKALYEHESLRLRIQGRGLFEPSGRLRRIVRIDQVEEHPVGEEQFDSQAPPIWEVVEAIGESVPEEEWSKVPTDLGVNLDHYLYGSRKDPEQ